MTKLPKLLSVTTAVGLLLLANACGGQYNNYSTDNPDPIDRPGDLNREDFIKSLSPRPAPEVKVEVKEPPLPKLMNTLTPPKAPKIASDKTISISVTEDIQLKDIFLEISRLADLDIEVASNVRGGIIFRATNRPVGEVVERIAQMAKLRYSVENGVLRVERDDNFTENYHVNFLNIIRKNSSKIENSTKLSSGGGSGSGSGSSGGSSSSSSSSGSSNNGSESSITTDSGGEGDLWASVERQLSALLGLEASGSAAGAGARGAGAGAAPSGQSNMPLTDKKFLSISREAGIITVNANSRDHEKVKEYIDQVKNYYSSQVLIEAKVVEVALNDEFRSGVNWELFSRSINNGVGITTNFGGFPPPNLSGDGNSVTISGLGGGDLNDSVITLGQVFGTTRTLSSPRLLAMNNQQAILSFAQNETYFTVQCQVTDPVISDSSTVPAKIEVTSQINSVPVGIILNINNSIDVKNNLVTMNVRPTLSRLTGVTVQDPSTTICLANAKALVDDPSDIPDIRSSIPQVDVREMDSVLTLKSGEIMVIGGMIEQRNINNDSGVPYASEIPIFGNAFKTVDKRNSVVQTVIFLKATIVPAYGVDSFDQNLYNKFNTDPRPFKF